jgi:hypothetical protein
MMKVKRAQWGLQGLLMRRRMQTVGAAKRAVHRGISLPI